MDAKKNGSKIPKDILKLTFEEAYNELKAATEMLEAKEVDLDATIKEYSRASALARHCANLLDEAEERVRVLIESEGVIELQGFDEDESE